MNAEKICFLDSYCFLAIYRFLLPLAIWLLHLEPHLCIFFLSYWGYTYLGWETFPFLFLHRYRCSFQPCHPDSPHKEYLADYRPRCHNTLPPLNFFQDQELAVKTLTDESFKSIIVSCRSRWNRPPIPVQIGHVHGEFLDSRPLIMRRGVGHP